MLFFFLETKFCTNAGNGIPIECAANQPNCVTNERGAACTAIRDASCPILTDNTNFTCSAVGKFPDPDNCKLFYNCDWNDDETEIIAEVMTCRTGEVL